MGETVKYEVNTGITYNMVLRPKGKIKLGEAIESNEFQKRNS